jgi:hypothetical protein
MKPVVNFVYLNICVKLFSYPKWLKTRKCFIATLSELCLLYTIRKIHENQVGLKLNATNQFLACADDVNLLGNNIETAKKNIKTLFNASKEAGIEINA